MRRITSLNPIAIKSIPGLPLNTRVAVNLLDFHARGELSKYGFQSEGAANTMVKHLLGPCVDISRLQPPNFVLGFY